MAGLATGLLDRRVGIEAASAGDDGYNETESWATLATVWARYLPVRGAEAREQLGREAQLSASFQIRHSSIVAPLLGGDGTTAYRLRFPDTEDGQLWDIKSAVEIGRRDGIEIVAVARAGAAS